MFINFADKAALGLAAVPIMHDLGISSAQYGVLSSSFYFLFSLSAIVVGFVANRVSVKWLLGGMGLIWALTQLPLLAAGSGLALLLFSRVDGGGLQLALLVIAFAVPNTIFAISITASAEIVPTRQRGAVLGAGVGIATVAGIISSLLTGMLVQHAASPLAGFSHAFDLAGVLRLLASLVALAVARPEHDRKSLQQKASGALARGVTITGGLTGRQRLAAHPSRNGAFDRDRRHLRPRRAGLARPGRRPGVLRWHAARGGPGRDAVARLRQRLRRGHRRGPDALRHRR
jgi:MFS family permease